MSMGSLNNPPDLRGKQVLVMGLGAHGGGLASARYCLKHGADVVVTDLRSRDELGEGADWLESHGVKLVLGEHRAEDFRNADIVIKNPAVPRTSPYLQHAAQIETDISLFLRRHSGPIHAVTGTKGKSTTASALHHLLSSVDPRVRLGGNITVSPLTFVDELTGDEPVVLELSSFQLGDLLLTPEGSDPAFPPFSTGIITNLMHDHQDYYASMDAYRSDKALVYRGIVSPGRVLLSADDPLSAGFHPPDTDSVVYVSVHNHEQAKLLPGHLAVVGPHQKVNLLFAAVAATLAGIDPARIRDSITEFPGVPHRLERIRTVRGITYYNDSAATIAEASLAAVQAFDRRVHLIAGGSDKGLSLESLAAAGEAAASMHLLSGTGTDRLLGEHTLNNSVTGPHPTLKAALEAARGHASDGEIVLLSPGCASFGMFLNEFDRGDQFRKLVHNLEP